MSQRSVGQVFQREALNRRTFLGKTATVVLGGLALPALLNACGGTSAPAAAGPVGQAGGTSGAAAGSATKLQLPTYVPFTGAKPDFPGTGQGVPPGFKSYPTQLATSVATPPGTGDTINAVAATYLEAPPALDRNAQWQAVNKALNADLKLPIINVSDYAAKFSTIIAGGDP